VECGEERSRTNEKDAASYLFDAVGDGDAVQRAEFQGSEDKEVECAWQDIGWFSHESMISHSDIDCPYALAERRRYRKPAGSRFTRVLSVKWDNITGWRAMYWATGVWSRMIRLRELLRISAR
jgi:hypothetical protein